MARIIIFLLLVGPMLSSYPIHEQSIFTKLYNGTVNDDSTYTTWGGAINSKNILHYLKYG